MVNKKYRKNWALGFFGFFVIFAIPGIIRGEVIWASWLVWIIWFVYFLPVRKRK
jgi:hypothetical protein